MRRGICTVGALLRAPFRARLREIGADFEEHRGLLESKFIISATPRQWGQIRQLEPKL